MVDEERVPGDRAGSICVAQGGCQRADLHPVVCRAAPRERTVRQTNVGILSIAWCVWLREVVKTQHRFQLATALHLRSAQRSANRSLAEIHLERVSRNGAHAIFKSWHIRLVSRRKLALAFFRLATRRAYRTAANALLSWKTAYENWVMLREGVGGLFAKVNGRVCGKFLWAWLLAARELKQHLDVGLRVLTRANTVCVSRFFANWRAVKWANQKSKIARGEIAMRRRLWALSQRFWTVWRFAGASKHLRIRMRWAGARRARNVLQCCILLW